MNKLTVQYYEKNYIKSSYFIIYVLLKLKRFQAPTSAVATVEVPNITANDEISFYFHFLFFKLLYV